MADVRAFRSGNWSDTTATSPWWNGTAIFAPAAGDVVYSNTWTITVDISVTTGTVTNASATSRTWKDGGVATVTSGGLYALNNGITLTANCTNGSTTALINISGTVSSSIVGGITGVAGHGVNSSSSGNTTITSALGIVGNGNFGIINAGSGTITIAGNATASAGANSIALYNSVNGTITITGNVTAGSVAVGAINSSTGIFNITGNVTGSGAVGATNSSTGIFNITGNVTAGISAAGATNASTGTFTVIGDITATNGVNGFTSSNVNATNRLSGSFISSANGTAAIYAPKYILNSTPLLAKTRYALNGTSTYVDMFTSDNNPNGGVATTDVRTGVSYGGGLVGTCAVPPASAVGYGVAVGQTTGNAVLNASDVATFVWAAASRTITGGTVTTLTNSPNVPSAASIASATRSELTVELAKVSALNIDRLAQCATTSIVGNLIAQSNS